MENGIERECLFIGGPFDGQTKKATTRLLNFFEGMTLTFTIDGIKHEYMWKEGTTFEYKGIRQ